MLILYIKCLFYNKLLLVSWLVFVLSFVFFTPLTVLTAPVGLMGIFLCKGGLFTIDTYKRLKVAYYQGKRPIVNPTEYCDKAALRWFEDEFPIEKELNPQ